jgi:hypothetical protein
LLIRNLAAQQRLNTALERMDTWRPISELELEELINSQLAECTPSQRELFSQIRVPLRPAPILRFGSTESVFVVALLGSTAVYYEDVEEGFNMSELALDGSILKPGFEQWKLRHVLHRLAL